MKIFLYLFAAQVLIPETPDSEFASESCYTDYDLDAVDNGCRPQWLADIIPDWLEKWMDDIINGCFGQACRLHDMRYDLGGTEKDRKRADKIFYKDMKKVVKKKVNFWFRWKHYFKAWRFYHLVRKFGKSAFSYERKKYFDLPRFNPEKLAHVDYSNYAWVKEGEVMQWVYLAPVKSYD